MEKAWFAALSVLFLSACGPSAARPLSQPSVKGQTPQPVVTPGGTEQEKCPGANPFVSHDRVKLADGRVLSYTASAGYIPLFEKNGSALKLRACLFHFSYTRDDQVGNANWPVSFLFNGGPTSSSSWIHLGGLGPKRFDFGKDGLQAGSSTLGDGASTLLASSDLVFVDPINTGYSRPATGVAPDEFNGLTEDADSIGDFIQGYLAQYRRESAPKFVIGESYGGMRTPVLARYLDEKLGIKLDGIVLISPWLDAIGDMIFDASDPADDLPYVNYLPEYATIAWYHHKISGGLQRKSLEEVYEKADEYARGDYLNALAEGVELSDRERGKVVKKLVELTGLPKSDFDLNGIRIDLDRFRNGVLKDSGQVVAYYDGRMNGKVADPAKNDPYDVFDPIFAAGMKTYFGGTLGIQSDLPYQDVYDPPHWPGANPQSAIEGGYLNVMGDLNTLLTRNPSMKFYIASGLFDMVCPAAEVHFMVSHLKPEVSRRIQIGHYPAGHPIYFGQESGAKFAAEMANFLR